MSKIIDFIKNNKWAQMGLALFIGLVVGALIYPSRTIIKEVKVEDTTKITSLKEENTKIKQEMQLQIDKITQEKENVLKISNEKIASLSSELKNVQNKTKRSYVKITKPDGTIEEREYQESENQEISNTISDVKRSYEESISIEKERLTVEYEKRIESTKKEYDIKIAVYEERIHKMEEFNKEEVNKRIIGLELGLMTNKMYYMHTNVDIWGPVFMGVQVQTNMEKTDLGLGIGLRF